MTEIEERLTPRDGLNNYHIVLTRMELPQNGGGQFIFAVTNSMQPTGEFQVSVAASGQSLDRMTVEAHDVMIDILRQLLFRAEKARINHDRNARPVLQVTPHDAAEGEFVVERRGAPERRGGVIDPAFSDFEVLG
jgi:hypothetical protein